MHHAFETTTTSTIIDGTCILPMHLNTTIVNISTPSVTLPQETLFCPVTQKTIHDCHTFKYRFCLEPHNLITTGKATRHSSFCPTSNVQRQTQSHAQTEMVAWTSIYLSIDIDRSIYLSRYRYLLRIRVYIPFRNGLRDISRCVQLVRRSANVLWLTAHFGNTASIVSNRSIVIHGQHKDGRA
jgi:hypothetical protein